MYGVEELKPILKGMVEAALDDTEPDNPVCRAITYRLLRESAPEGDRSELQFGALMDRLDRIEAQQSRGSRGPTVSPPSASWEYALKLHEGVDSREFFPGLNYERLSSLLQSVTLDPKANRLLLSYSRPLSGDELTALRNIPEVEEIECP